MSAETSPVRHLGDGLVGKDEGSVDPASAPGLTKSRAPNTNSRGSRSAYVEDIDEDTGKAVRSTRKPASTRKPKASTTKKPVVIDRYERLERRKNSSTTAKSLRKSDTPPIVHLNSLTTGETLPKSGNLSTPDFYRKQLPPMRPVVAQNEALPAPRPKPYYAKPLSSSAYYQMPPPAQSPHASPFYSPPSVANYFSPPPTRPLSSRFDQISRTDSAGGTRSVVVTDPVARPSSAGGPRNTNSTNMARAEADYNNMPPYRRPSSFRRTTSDRIAESYNGSNISRRPESGPSFISYDLTEGRTIEVGSNRGRRGQSYYEIPGTQVPYYKSLEESKFKSSYQESDKGSPPLTAETLERQIRRQNGDDSGWSTRANKGSEDSQDGYMYRQPATNRIARSGAGENNENVTIKVVGQARVEVGGARLEISDGGEVSFTRPRNGIGSLPSQYARVLDRPKTQRERLAARFETPNRGPKWASPPKTIALSTPPRNENANISSSGANSFAPAFTLGSGSSPVSNLTDATIRRRKKPEIVLKKSDGKGLKKDSSPSQASYLRSRAEASQFTGEGGSNGRASSQPQYASKDSKAPEFSLQQGQALQSMPQWESNVKAPDTDGVDIGHRREALGNNEDENDLIESENPANNEQNTGREQASASMSNKSSHLRHPKASIPAPPTEQKPRFKPLDTNDERKVLALAEQNSRNEDDVDTDFADSFIDFAWSEPMLSAYSYGNYKQPTSTPEGAIGKIVAANQQAKTSLFSEDLIDFSAPQSQSILDIQGLEFSSPKVAHKPLPSFDDYGPHKKKKEDVNVFERQAPDEKLLGALESPVDQTILLSRKAAHLEHIERRYAQIDPPIPSNILAHLPTFQQARDTSEIEKSIEMSENDWMLLISDFNNYKTMQAAKIISGPASMHQEHIAIEDGAGNAITDDNVSETDSEENEDGDDDDVSEDNKPWKNTIGASGTSRMDDPFTYFKRTGRTRYMTAPPHPLATNESLQTSPAPWPGIDSEKSTQEAHDQRSIEQEKARRSSQHQIDPPNGLKNAAYEMERSLNLGQGVLDKSDELLQLLSEIEKKLKDQEEDTISVRSNFSNASSIASLADSVFSFVSGSSISSISVAGPVGAGERFVALLLADSMIHSLCTEALNINTPDRFERHLRRMLKDFAVQLRQEAGNVQQKHAAHFVRYRARNSAHMICSALVSKVEEPGDSIERLAKIEIIGQEREVEVEAEEIGSDNSNSDQSEEEVDNLQNLEIFIRTSRALEMLRDNLRIFVRPPQPQDKPMIVGTKNNCEGDRYDTATYLGDEKDNIRETNPILQSTETEHSQVRSRKLRWHARDYFSYIFTQIGLVPQRVPLGKTRIEWRCKCGHKIYDDFKELRSGGLERYKMQLTPRNIRKGRQEPNSNLKSRATRVDSGSSFNSITKTLSNSIYSTLSAFSFNSKKNIENGLPLHTMQPTNPFIDHANTPPPSSIPLQDLLFLLLCYDSSRYATRLLQLDLVTLNASSDRAVFTLLRSNYHSMRSKWVSFFSLQTLEWIKFVHFEMYRSELVDVRKVNDIPPPEHVEYKYAPAPPDVIPPVGDRHMMHLFHHPECADEETICLSRFPKKLKEKLKCQGGINPGWGLQFVEAWDFKKIWILVFVLFGLGSLILGVMWAVYEHSIQDAFALAAYMLTFATISIGLMQALLLM